jgi:hypothetical protein
MLQRQRIPNREVGSFQAIAFIQCGTNSGDALIADLDSVNPGGPFLDGLDRSDTAYHN